MVLIGDNHRDQRFLIQVETGMINTIIYALFHRIHGNAHPVIMGLYGSGAGLKGIHLALRIAGSGIHMAAPVIQHLRNMMDFPGLFRTAEDKIIILGSVKLLAESADGFHQVPVYHKQMADIIYAGQKIWIKVRLKVRIEKCLSVHIQLIFIRINHIIERILIHGLDAFKQSVRRQSIIVISQHQKIPLSHVHGRIGIS